MSFVAAAKPGRIASTEMARRGGYPPGPAPKIGASMREIPYGYCACGCGEKTRLVPQTNVKRGLIKGEPHRFVYGHNGRGAHSGCVAEDRGFVTPCWVWQGTPGSTGYPRVNVGGRFYAAHRLFYEQHKGPIPDGLHLDHLCRVPMCVNPDHLEAVTPKENLRRGCHIKLSAEDAEAIRRSDKSQRVLAAEYGVASTTIHNVRSGRTWT